MAQEVATQVRRASVSWVGRVAECGDGRVLQLRRHWLVLPRSRRTWQSDRAPLAVLLVALAILLVALALLLVPLAILLVALALLLRTMWQN
jgi:hypothetical protein